ncbi:hypothetical protein KHA96_11925 [Bacillus sp. FJAT-49711]|uniref:CBO0543 family protein n=1 Tax=Bacillus sp. FJAT-49711 TaxID=2833585 RepID=UPI001BCA06C1|nr:CBO0543 family protein [Bacillus sp. FJAT-49711]MBS4219024.1 hypothetical protein [Bacillus sp. FJAT-49711]
MFLLIIITFASILGIILMPKNVAIWELYFTGLFAAFIAAIADYYLDVKLDLYGFFRKGVDWEYLPIFIVIYPAVSMFIVNFYPYQKPLTMKFIFILGCTLLTTFFEYIALHTNVFYYNHWKLWYSAFCYPILYTVLIFHMKFIRKLTKSP